MGIDIADNYSIIVVQERKRHATETKVRTAIQQ